MSIHDFVFSSMPYHFEPAEKQPPRKPAASSPILIDAQSRLILNVGGAFSGDSVSDLLAWLAGAMRRCGCPTALNLDNAGILRGSRVGKSAWVREAARLLRGKKVERPHRAVQDAVIDRSQKDGKPGDARTKREE